MSTKTDRQLLTELLDSLMDEEVLYVRERLMAIVEFSLHDEKLIRDGMANSGASADLYINTLKRIKSVLKYDNVTIPSPTVDPSGFEEITISTPESTPPVIVVKPNRKTKIKKR